MTETRLAVAWGKDHPFPASPGDSPETACAARP
jgi:hypothetical protein